MEVYNSFLFSTFRDKGYKLLNLVISPDFKYEFPVETNFYVKQINKNDNINIIIKKIIMNQILIEIIIMQLIIKKKINN